MVRGTTPTLNFTLPFEVSTITVCSIAFAQDENVVLEKTLTDCQAYENVLSVELTEAETLLFDSQKVLEIQVRCACGAAKMASQVIRVDVGRILKDGCL